MRSVVCVVALAFGAPTAARADTRVTSGQLDVWDGPFATIADATVHDLSPATDLAAFGDDEELPSDLPIDDLVALRRDIAPTTDEYMHYRLAVHTKAGWFVSGQLGISQNRNFCELASISGDPSRFVIRYKCEVGRFDWASKDFVLLCGVDTTGRPACGRTVVSAQHNVHRGGKEDSATDVITDTLSCRTKISGDTIKLVPLKPDTSDANTPHINRISTCPAPTRFALRGPFTPGTHAPPPLFDVSGRWRP